MEVKRSWDGKQWQSFAHQLVQLRHGPENVQIVPDRVRGDAGIEYFSVDGCMYQSYAPEESSDTAKAASAMKRKGSRDLRKLDKNADTVRGLLGEIKIRRWILLCPFLDDKEVVAYIREKGDDLKALGIIFLTHDFRALVQSQEDFTSELAELRQRSLGPTIEVVEPSSREILDSSATDLAERMREKLSRAFPSDDDIATQHKKETYIRAHLTCENALAALKLDHPALWEKSKSCLSAEEKRLIMLGAVGTAPVEQLQNSLNRLEESLKSELSSLPPSIVSEISMGTLSDWLMRCPLDFLEDDSE